MSTVERLPPNEYIPEGRPPSDVLSPERQPVPDSVPGWPTSEALPSLRSGMSLSADAPDPTGTARPGEAPEPLAEPASTAEEEAKPSRVTLAGRLGQTPRFRTTPKGTLVATFPLGVRGDDDKTVWHQIVAFDKRAERVRESLKRGDAVELVGYEHERRLRRRNGGTRTVREIYATVIKPR